MLTYHDDQILCCYLSKQANTIIAIELTMPLEKHCDMMRHTEESLKYADLIADCREAEWWPIVLPVEVC